MNVLTARLHHLGYNIRHIIKCVIHKQPRDDFIFLIYLESLIKNNTLNLSPRLTMFLSLFFCFVFVCVHLRVCVHACARVCGQVGGLLVHCNNFKMNINSFIPENRYSG